MTLDPSNRIVQGFWSGPLTTMERLSMQSFIQNGHEFRLFSYEPIEGVPEEVMICDAAEIVPKFEMETFRCVQQFSDFFRIALLLKRGGWYSDLDNILVKPLDFDSPYVFYRDHDESTISFALSKAPVRSPLMYHCYDYLAQMSVDERARLTWQEIGTEFVTGAVEYFHLVEFAQRGYVFDPVHWKNYKSLVDPDVNWDLSRSHAVHLFHAAWNKGPEDRLGKGWDLGQVSGEPLWTDGKYPEGCLYEQLKRKYL